MSIVISMDEQDFDLLTENSTYWTGARWNPQEDAERFESTVRGETVKAADWPGWDLKMAYWTDDSWAKVILMRSFLRNTGQECEILWDLGMETWLILTDYKTATWRDLPYTYMIETSDDGEIWMPEAGALASEKTSDSPEDFAKAMLANWVNDHPEPVTYRRIRVWAGTEQDITSMAQAVVNA